MLVLLPGLALAQHGLRFDHHANALATRELLQTSPALLVDPVRQRSARVIGDWEHVAFFGWAGLQIIAFWWAWQSGNSARLRDVLRRRFRSRWVVRFLFGAAMGVVARIAALPFALAGYRIYFNAGLTEERLPVWIINYLISAAVVAVIAGIVVALVLELVDRTRLWYLAFIAILYVGVIGVVALEPVLFSPLAVLARPAPAAIVAQGDAVARAEHTRPVPLSIFASSARTQTLVARTSGLGPFTTILIGDITDERLSPGERRVLLARQYAHVATHDNLQLTLIAITLFVFTAAIAVLLSDRIGFRRDDDALSRLALVAVFVGSVALVTFPLYNAYARGIEARADAIAMSATHAPADAVRLFVRRADDDMTPLCDRRTFRWYFNDRPSLGTRIAAIRGTNDPCPK